MPVGLREERVMIEAQQKPYATAVLAQAFQKFLIFTNTVASAEKLNILLNSEKIQAKTELLSSALDHDWKRLAATR